MPTRWLDQRPALPCRARGRHSLKTEERT
jgi:hypothetical protein